MQGKYQGKPRRIFLSNNGFLSEDNEWLSTIFQGLSEDFEGLSKIMTDYERLSMIIKGLMKDNQRQWLRIIELKEGTFLVLEAIQEYENSGNYTRAQGKYLPVIRRHILRDYGLLSEDNGLLSTIFEDYQKTLKDYWKTMIDHKWQSKIIKDCGIQSKTKTDLWMILWRLWRLMINHWSVKNQYQFKK